MPQPSGLSAAFEVLSERTREHSAERLLPMKKTQREMAFDTTSCGGSMLLNASRLALLVQPLFTPARILKQGPDPHNWSGSLQGSVPVSPNGSNAASLAHSDEKASSSQSPAHRYDAFHCSLMFVVPNCVLVCCPCAPRDFMFP